MVAGSENRVVVGLITMGREILGVIIITWVIGEVYGVVKEREIQIQIVQVVRPERDIKIEIRM